MLDPMGLHHTAGTITAAIPEPVLHTFTAERRVPTDSTSYEEATFWNTQWGTPMGANETSNIDDMITTAVKIGTGALLSKESFEAMTKQQLLGFGKKQANCEPSCFKQIPIYNYALGVVRSGDWLVQDPLVSAQSATEAYYPPQKIAIAVVTTYDKEAFNAQGVEPNASDPIFRAIAKVHGLPDAVPAHERIVRRRLTSSSGPPGTRTRNLRIKSPSRCQLRQRPERFRGNVQEGYRAYRNSRPSKSPLVAPLVEVLEVRHGAPPG